ncbi:MAG: TonB-dependent receptor plug domain-containing protein, partial [Saprospiraceae bacterium]|nr:TonB-dependent receptor plug domain-containing protein [Saprospiraceae bacterium]
MKMIRSLPAICLLVIAVELTGQVSLQIGIYDNKNRPLEHMHIRVGSISKASDQMGIAVFELPGEGRYYVRIEGIGYQNSEDSIDVVDGSMLSLMLDPETYQLPGIELIGAWIKPDQPFTYGSISGHELERDNLGLDVPYLLKSLPSTVVSSDAGTGIGYTGLRIRGSDPSRINVTIDGIPLNDSESQGVFWVDLPDFAGSSESIQVQRGVGTSTHGAGAFGGTINLMTSTLEREPFGEVQATLGSFGTRKGTIKFGSGLLFDRFSLDGRISTIQSDGYIDRASADLNSYFFSGKIIDDNQSIRINLFSGKEITYQAWNGVPAQYVDSNPTYNGAGIRSDGSFHDAQVD